jgi:hypothetical protein
LTVLGKALEWESVGPAKDLTPETQNPSKGAGAVSYPNNSSTSDEGTAFASQQTKNAPQAAERFLFT